MTASVSEIVQTREGNPSQLIEVLQDIQDRCGYISEEAMREVADRLAVAQIEVYRVVNYYAAFSLAPKGRHLITVCMGTACHVRGGARLLDEVQGQLGLSPGETTEDGLFTLESVNCLGACALGPVVVVDGKYHDHMTPGKLRALLEKVRQAEKEVATDA